MQEIRPNPFSGGTPTRETLLRPGLAG
jgi:hypothetical protein